MEKIKRKDGFRYRPSYYFGSKKVNGPYFKRITDAKDWKARVLSERMKGLALGEKYVREEDVNFKNYANKWLENHVRVNCASKTYASYESILRIHIFPYFSELNLDDITEEKAGAFMAFLKKGRGPKGVENIWIVFRSILKKAKKDKLIRFYPLEDISLPKPDLRQDSFWIKDEVNQFLLSNRHDALYPFYFVAIHTGLRLAELCGLKWDRIDFSNNLITVTRTRDRSSLKDTTKTRMKRLVPMTVEVKALMLNLFNRETENRFVFLEKDGSEVDYGHFYRKFRKAQEHAKMKNLIRFHDLRHSFASNFMMNGGNVFDLQKILRHTDIKITMRYAYFTPDHLQSSLKFMGIANISESSFDNLKMLGH